TLLSESIIDSLESRTSIIDALMRPSRMLVRRSSFLIRNGLPLRAANLTDAAIAMSLFVLSEKALYETGLPRPVNPFRRPSHRAWAIILSSSNFAPVDSVGVCSINCSPSVIFFPKTFRAFGHASITEAAATFLALVPGGLLEFRYGERPPPLFLRISERSRRNRSMPLISVAKTQNCNAKYKYAMITREKMYPIILN